MNSSFGSRRPGATRKEGAVRRNLHDQIEAVTQVQPSKTGASSAMMWRDLLPWPTNNSSVAFPEPLVSSKWWRKGTDREQRRGGRTAWLIPSPRSGPPGRSIAMKRFGPGA